MDSASCQVRNVSFRFIRRRASEGLSETSNPCRLVAGLVGTGVACQSYRAGTDFNALLAFRGCNNVPELGNSYNAKSAMTGLWDGPARQVWQDAPRFFSVGRSRAGCSRSARAANCRWRATIDGSAPHRVTVRLDAQPALAFKSCPQKRVRSGSNRRFDVDFRRNPSEPPAVC